MFCSIPDLYDPYDYEIPSKFDFYEIDSNELEENEKDEILFTRLGVLNFERTKKFHLEFFRIPQFDKYISMLNEMIEKDDKTDLELAIINTIDILAIIHDTINFNVNFMLCIIALESLILGGKNENIGYKLAERVALLAGHSEEWLKYCYSKKMINPSLDADNLSEARIILNRTIIDIYNKRSRFTHSGISEKEKISYDDYIFVSMLLKSVLIKILDLYDFGKGLLYREHGRYPKRSLEEHIKKVKYSGQI